MPDLADANNTPGKKPGDTFDIWEVKAVGDFLFDKIARFLFMANDARGVISMFCEHYPIFKQTLDGMEQAQLYREYRWRAMQLRRMADFLVNEVQPADQAKKKDVVMWISFLHSVLSEGHG